MPRKIKVSPFLKQCFVTAAVGNNIISNGCSLGFPAILLPQLREPGSGIQLTTEQESWIASMTIPFLLAGSFVCSSIMDRFGRRPAHYTLTVIFTAAWIVTVLATDIKILILGRALAGIASGQLINVRSVLIGEYTSPKNRGAFLTTISLAQALGILLVHFFGSFFSWQITALMCAFFPFTSLVMITYTPESPSWLAGRGRYEECKEVFRWLRGDDEEDELTELITAQAELTKLNNKENKASDSRVQSALKIVVKKEFYKPVIIAFHANSLLQFSGGTIMSSYTTIILSLIMGSSANVYFWMILLDTQRMLTNLLAVYAISRFKRRPMLFSNGILCGVVTLLTSVYVHGSSRDWIPWVGVWLPALLVLVHTFTVGMAMVPMPNVIAGEIFPLAYRGIGSTISMATSCVIVFIVVKTFLGMTDAIGLQGTYLVYSIVLMYCLAVLWVLLPETKGRTLQEIEDEMRGRSLKDDEVDVRQPLQTSLVTVESACTKKEKM